MPRKIKPIPTSIGKACKRTPYAVKLARMRIKTVLAVTAVVMVAIVVALAVAEAVLAAATLAAFGANPYRKPISI
jgi:hypothetical protein